MSYPMSKKPEVNPAKVAAQLKSLRSQIDKLDLQILKLINERAECAVEIGQLKTEAQAEVFSPAREEEVIQNLLDSSKGPLQPVTIRAVYRELMSGARALQKMLKVSFLGPEYSYSHIASIERFGHGVEFVGVGSIPAVFDEVNRGHADYGVVPLENSTDGRIADTLDQFLSLPQIRICAEVRLRIHHNLLANCHQQEIRRVYSKEQALSQTRNWLSKNVPQAQLIPVNSTSAAAELALREPGAAAVASRQAGVRYGLKMLFEHIEDNPQNETRFAVIGKNMADRSGRDKTAIMFQTNNNPGSLLEALMIFKNNKISLSMIESFPARTGKGDYVFFIDFEGHVEDAKVKKTLDSLEKHSRQIIILGSFTQSESLE